MFSPAFNDAKSIGTLVRDAFAILPNLSHDYEVIVVDDGSTDDSRQILQKLTNRYSSLRVIYHPRRLLHTFWEISWLWTEQCYNRIRNDQ